MFPTAMSNSTSFSEEAIVSSGTRVQDFSGLNPLVSTISPQHTQKNKREAYLETRVRYCYGSISSNFCQICFKFHLCYAEVIALSPDLNARYATRGSKGIKTFNFTVEAITFLGS